MTSSSSGRAWRGLVLLLASSSASLFALSSIAGAQEATKTQLPQVDVEQAKAVAKSTSQKKKATAAPAAAVPDTPPMPPQPPANETSALALGTYNPALDLEGLTLPPGTTITTAGPVQGYRALSAMSSTKTATPIERIPQSIQVVPQSLIKDQTSISVNEAVRNVSNVQSFNDLNIGNTDMAGAKIRGLKAEQWLDGLVVNYNTGDRDSFANVERIEVLKGPAAILYGGGSGAPAAGAINVISKLPTGTASGSVGVTVGSDSFVRPYFDINQPISKDGTVLFRMTGEYTSADSFVDVLEQDRYSINPTLTLTNKIDTTLTIQARKSRFTQQAYAGLPAIVTENGPFQAVDRHLFAGDPNIPRSYTEVEGLTVTFDHKFDPIWSFNVKGRVSRSEFDQNSQGPTTATPDGFAPNSWQLVDTDVFQKQQDVTINPNVQAKFSAGPTDNVVLVGGDYSRSTDRGHMFSNFGGYGLGLLPEVNIFNPAFTTPYVDPTPSLATFFPFFDFENVYTTKGVYGQVQTTLYDRIHLLGGLRFASIDVEYLEKAIFDLATFSFVSRTFTTQEDKVLPRAGIVVDLVPGLSAYASYSEGMRWAGFSQARDVKPEFSEQREVGLKFALGSVFSGTVALFDIDRQNIPTVNQGVVSILTDQQSRGFETDLVYQPNANWQFLASYGFVNAEIVSGANAGRDLVEVPAHSGRFWVNYAFDGEVLKGWSVGGGIYASSAQYVDIANVYETDPYFTIDAKIGYDSEHYSASLNVKNITDEEYYVPYSWFGGQVAPGAERSFYGSFAYKY